MEEIQKLERQYSDLRRENRHEEADKLRRQIDDKVLYAINNDADCVTRLLVRLPCEHDRVFVND